MADRTRETGFEGVVTNVTRSLSSFGRGSHPTADILRSAIEKMEQHGNSVADVLERAHLKRCVDWLGKCIPGRDYDKGRELAARIDFFNPLKCAVLDSSVFEKDSLDWLGKFFGKFWDLTETMQQKALEGSGSKLTQMRDYRSGFIGEVGVAIVFGRQGYWVEFSNADEDVEKGFDLKVFRTEDDFYDGEAPLLLVDAKCRRDREANSEEDKGFVGGLRVDKRGYQMFSTSQGIFRVPIMEMNLPSWQDHLEEYSSTVLGIPSDKLVSAGWNEILRQYSDIFDIK